MSFQIHIPVKPLSVNDAWQGRRFRSPMYDSYEKTVCFYLLQIKPALPPPPYKISYVWGVSSMASDVDNPVKPLQDILAKRFKFNDKDIMTIIATKVRVPKGKEFSSVEITTDTR